MALDDDAEGEPGEVFSGVIWTGGARFARVTTDRTIDALKVLAMDAGHLSRAPPGSGAVADAAVSLPDHQPGRLGRQQSMSFTAAEATSSSRDMNPLQKVIVYTAGRNNDPDPEAMIQAIYYMHAISRGYGDIDPFLIDWQGRVYKGRHARVRLGRGHRRRGRRRRRHSRPPARDFNDGTVEIARRIGTFTDRLPPTAQEASLG